jgi:hypothetical protein
MLVTKCAKTGLLLKMREKNWRVTLFKSYILCAALVLLPGCVFGSSIVIDYSWAQVGNTGNTYIYTYSVYNNGSLPGTPTGMVPLQIFDILFDPTLYQETSITNVTPEPLNTQWSPTILSSVGSEPAAFDAESQSGIAVGNTVSGFAVEFNYLGQGNPGSQPFEIYNLTNALEPPYTMIQTGSTQLAGAPEPSSGSYLVGILLVCGVWAVRRKLVQHSPRIGQGMTQAYSKELIRLS